MTAAEFEREYYLRDSSLDKFDFDAAAKKLTLETEIRTTKIDDVYPTLKVKAERVTVTEIARYNL